MKMNWDEEWGWVHGITWDGLAQWRQTPGLETRSGFETREEN